MKQRQRLEKIAAETPTVEAENPNKRQPLTLQDENARLSPWNLAATSPVAVQYIARKDGQRLHPNKTRWVPFSPGHHLPQPPALWRAKVEKDFPPASYAAPSKISGHARSLSDGYYVGAHHLGFPPGTIHFDARQDHEPDSEVRWTTRFGRAERDFNARAKGWKRIY